MSLNPFCCQIIERLLNVCHAQRDMRQSAASAVFLNLLCDRRFRIQRLDQLHQVRTIAHLQQHFAHLIRAQHVLAMHFLESHRLVGLDVGFQFAGFDRNGHVIEK